MPCRLGEGKAISSSGWFGQRWALCSMFLPPLAIRRLCPSFCVRRSLSLSVSVALSLLLFLCDSVSVSGCIFFLSLSVYMSLRLSLSCFLCRYLSLPPSIFPLHRLSLLPSLILSAHPGLSLSPWSSRLQRRVQLPRGQGHLPPAESLSPARLSLGSLASGSHQVLLRMAGQLWLQHLPGQEKRHPTEPYPMGRTGVPLPRTPL